MSGTGSGSHVFGVGSSGSHVQEQEQEKVHMCIDNDNDKTATTTTQRQRRPPLRQRRRMTTCGSASDLEHAPSDVAPGAQGSATHVGGSSAGVGQVGVLADGARPATQKGIIPGGLITPCVRTAHECWTRSHWAMGNATKWYSKSSPSLGH